MQKVVAFVAELVFLSSSARDGDFLVISTRLRVMEASGSLANLAAATRLRPPPANQPTSTTTTSNCRRAPQVRSISFLFWAVGGVVR